MNKFSHSLLKAQENGVKQIQTSCARCIQLQSPIEQIQVALRVIEAECNLFSRFLNIQTPVGHGKVLGNRLPLALFSPPFLSVWKTIRAQSLQRWLLALSRSPRPSLALCSVWNTPPTLSSAGWNATTEVRDLAFSPPTSLALAFSNPCLIFRRTFHWRCCLAWCRPHLRRSLLHVVPLHSPHWVRK